MRLTCFLSSVRRSSKPLRRRRGSSEDIRRESVSIYQANRIPLVIRIIFMLVCDLSISSVIRKIVQAQFVTVKMTVIPFQRY
jgi:hypothetical protein